MHILENFIFLTHFTFKRRRSQNRLSHLNRISKSIGLKTNDLQTDIAHRVIFLMNSISSHEPHNHAANKIIIFHADHVVIEMSFVYSLVMIISAVRFDVLDLLWVVYVVRTFFGATFFSFLYLVC